MCLCYSAAILCQHIIEFVLSRDAEWHGDVGLNKGRCCRGDDIQRGSGTHVTLHIWSNNNANNTQFIYICDFTLASTGSSGSCSTLKSFEIYKCDISIIIIIIIIIVRIWLYKVIHSLNGKKLLKASETDTTDQKSQNIKVITSASANLLLARS